MKSLNIILLVPVLILGCTYPMEMSEISFDAQQTESLTPVTKQNPDGYKAADRVMDVKDCELKEIEIPELPKDIPGYTQLDEATGLHFTGTPVEVDFDLYRFKISGLVEKPLILTYDDLRCMPKISSNADLVCPGFFVDVANWSGVPINYLMELARINPEARQIIMVSADGYERHLALDLALAEENFLAYEWESQPIPVLHGFPLRAVIPGMDGSFWVKWLVEIRVE